ncbi:MAG: hypothetical protein AB8G95_20800 [Anaerolineae bacterium]
MIRLIIIRFIETIARNFVVIIAPAIIVTLLFAVLQVIKKPQYLSGATVQIRYNDEISKVIGYEKFETDPKDPSERMVWELQELMQTDAFVDKIIAQVDFKDHNGVNPVANTQSEMREYLRDNVQFLITGLTQIGILVYMPTYTSSIDVTNAIYDLYLTHQIETFGGTGRDLVEFMTLYLDAKTNQRDLVNAELSAYLKSHPEHPFYKRREIEEAQISLLITARDDLTSDIEYTEDILDLGFLVEGTSDRYFKETFILLDAPFEPVPMTTKTKKITGVIQGAVLGTFLSIVTIGLLVIFDRRITLPLDLLNITDLPLLTMIEMEEDKQKQRYNFRHKRKPITQRLKDRLKQLTVAGGADTNSRSRRGHRPNKNLNSVG